MRVVCIVAPFAPRGVGTREKFILSSPRGKWAQETFAVCPQQRYATREPGKVQGWDRVGIVEGSCGYRVCGVSIRGKFVLSRNLNDCRVAYLEVKVQVRDQVRVVGIVVPFAPRGSVPGENSFYGARWLNVVLTPG